MGRPPPGETDGAPAAVRRQAFVRARLTQAPCPRPAQPSNDQGNSDIKRIYAARLLPDGQDSAHNKVTDELVASIDAEKLHTLLAEQRASQLHGGHESEPHVEAVHQPEVQVLRA